MEEKKKFERKRKFVHDVQKIEGSRRRKTSPKDRTATVREHHFIWNATETQHIQILTLWVRRCFFFKRHPGVLSVSVGFCRFLYPGGVLDFIFKIIPGGVVIFEFCARETMAATCAPRAQPSFMLSLLPAIHHDIISMIISKKSKKKNWWLNFVLICDKYSSDPSAPKPFVQTSF